MGKILIALSLTLCLAGCGPKASFDGYRQMMESWRGRHIDQLVEHWGPPQGQYTFDDGRKMYSFTERWRVEAAPVLVPSVGLGWSRRHFYGGYGLGLGGWSGATVREMYCETRVITDRKGLIKEFAFQGNSCRALPPQTGRP